MKRSLILCLLFAGVVTAQTKTSQISYSYTTFNNQDFRSHWGLTEKQVNQYIDYMEVEGKYRYQHLTPLEVLAIASFQKGDEVEGDYWAKRSAKQELLAVKAQLLFAISNTKYRMQISSELKIEEQLKLASKQANALKKNEILQQVAKDLKKGKTEPKKVSEKGSNDTQTKTKAPVESKP